MNQLLTMMESDSLTDIPQNCVLRKCQYLAYVKVKNRLQGYLEGGLTINDSGSYIVQMATGTGKSGVIALLSSCLPQPFYRVLVVTPSDGLRTQLRQTLDVSRSKQSSFWAKVDLWPENVTVRICSSANDMPEPRRRAGRHITVTTVQLLHSYRKSRGSHLQNYYDLIIFDEGHKKPSQEWDETVENLNVPIILMTATPYRSDGRSLKSEIIYRYTFEDALETGSKILKSVKIHSLDFRSDMLLAIQTIESKLDQIGNNWNSDSHTPKAIIRAGSASEVTEITNLLNSNGHNAVGVHSTYSRSNNLTLVSKKSGIPPESQYIVHQHMLLEGYDDPEISIAVFLDGSEDARIFIQQVGRSVRRITDLPTSVSQQAHIYCPNQVEAKQTWLSYLKFESDPDNYVFSGERFIPKLGALGHDFEKALYFRMAVQIRTGFTNNRTNRNSLYLEVKNWIKNQPDFRNSISFKKNMPGRFQSMCFVFERVSVPTFLSETSFENIKLAYILLAFSRDHLFIQSSVSRYPSVIKNLEVVDPKSLSKIVPKSELNISSMQLKNIADTLGTIRARSFWADNANRHLSPTRDGTFATHSLRWWNNADEINESISLASGKYSSNEWLDLPTFLDWCKDLDEKLKFRGASHKVFQKLARTSKKSPGTPYLVRMEIPHSADVTDWTDRAVSVSGGYLYIEISSLKGSISGIGGRHNNQVEVELLYDSVRKQYSLDWADENRYFEIFFQNDQADLLKWLKDKRRISVMTSNGVCYVTGKLYEQRQPVKSHLQSYLNKAAIYGATTSEMTRRTSQSNVWPQTSVFGVFERRHLGVARLFGNFDVVICDDGANEYADFVCFDRIGKRIVFVHCKWASGRGVRINDVYVVLGQAVKNVDNMWHKPSSETVDRWNNGNHYGRIRTRD